jgi:ubiquinone/menaquinone biosynthesis C-methylase UbiE
MKLLPKELLVKTGPVDHADWNYRPILGPISRTRFRAIGAMLRGQRFSRLLEMGYGSGVFLPELGAHTDELFGVDLHKFAPTVSEHLKKANLSAQLFSSDARSLPFPAHFFPCVVAVSVLEFVDDLDAVCCEIRRVLTADGVLLVVTPGSSPILDAGLKLLTGESASRDFGSRRQNLIPTLLRHFSVREEHKLGLPFLPLYTALKLGSRPALAAAA